MPLILLNAVLMKKTKQQVDVVEFVLGGPLPVDVTRAAIDRTSLEFEDAESFATRAETALAKAIQKHYKLGTEAEVWNGRQWVRYRVVRLWMTQVFLRRWRFGPRLEMRGDSAFLRRPEETTQPTDPDIRRMNNMP